MGRKAKKCPKNCLKHLLILKPVHYSAFFSRERSMSFCPQNITEYGTYLKFNRDRKHYTASFILTSDQIKLLNNNGNYMAEHERFKQQQSQQKAQIMIAKPRDKNNFCNVCKQIYDDYQQVQLVLFQHIDSNIHKKNTQINPYNQHMLKLCTNFNENAISEQFITTDDNETSQLKNNFNTDNSQTNQAPFFLNNRIELPELLFQIRSTRESLEGAYQCKQIKSFHQYEQINTINKFENFFDSKFENNNENNLDNNFLQHSVFKQLNENCFIPNYGCFKNIDQTASPIKGRINKPIILTSTITKIDE